MENKKQVNSDVVDFFEDDITNLEPVEENVEVLDDVVDSEENSTAFDSLVMDNDNEELEVLDERVTTVENQDIAEYEESYVNEINCDDTLQLNDSDNITEKKSFINSVTIKKDGSKSYVDYKTRVVNLLLIVAALIVITVLFLIGAFSVTPATKVNYKESSNLDYNVYLKPNDFYDQEYIGKNKLYVASLINSILIDFRYNYNIEKQTNVNFRYEIVAKLNISDGNGANTYFEKDYVLVSGKTGKIDNGTNYGLYEQVNIDYDYYNSLANSFKQQYGVDTTSNLTVSLIVHKKSDIGSSSASTMYVKIPLSEKSIDIELNYQDINNSSYLIETNDSSVDNIAFGILAGIAIIVLSFVIFRLIRLLTLLQAKKSIYDKYIEKILNEYDRLIVENGTGPALSKNNVIKISKFEELLDVRDNLKLPIMYYVVARHVKCYFYIKHDSDLYLLTIKAVDLEEATNHNKQK